MLEKTFDFEIRFLRNRVKSTVLVEGRGLIPKPEKGPHIKS